MNRFVLYAAIVLGGAAAPSSFAVAQQAVSPAAIKEHMEVIGSDGQHVGTVDKIEGETIALTRNNPAAGGQHHAVPLAWAVSVAGNKLMLNQTAEAAKSGWQTTAAPPADKK